MAVESSSSQKLAALVESARGDPRRRFGHYLILDELGKGGMGVVYRAWDERVRRPVALKIPLADAAISVERFDREAEAVGRLRHPNIVSVHEVGEQDRRHFLAMDLIDGKTLLARLEPGPQKMALTKAVEVVRDVARAVQ